jgi:secondary thiamine-phosphate synthase enzyme
MIFQDVFTVDTSGRGSYDVTGEVQRLVRASGVATGLCHVFVRHTSASLMICENADPSVRRDLERFMADLAPDGDPRYEHDSEGPDDMPAHIRSILTCTDLNLPVSGGRAALGTWQGVYLWEHRHRGHRRSLIVTISGE